jgi:hypothetical protein
MSEIENNERSGQLYTSVRKEIKSLIGRLDSLLWDLEQGDFFTDSGYVERANEIERYLVAYKIVHGE